MKASPVALAALSVAAILAVPVALTIRSAPAQQAASSKTSQEAVVAPNENLVVREFRRSRPRWRRKRIVIPNFRSALLYRWNPRAARNADRHPLRGYASRFTSEVARGRTDQLTFYQDDVRSALPAQRGRRLFYFQQRRRRRANSISSIVTTTPPPRSRCSPTGNRATPTNTGPAAENSSPTARRDVPATTPTSGWRSPRIATTPKLIICSRDSRVAAGPWLIGRRTIRSWWCRNMYRRTKAICG